MRENTKITVIDSIMGSGKTTWAINEMTNTGDNFMYVTPYLGETNRICGLDENGNSDPTLNKVEGKYIKRPFNYGKGKIGNLLELLQMQEDIATTHEAFKRLTTECKEAIKEGEYILFLDETIDAIKEYATPHKDDIRFLSDKGVIEIDVDGYVKWLDDNYTDTSYNEIKVLAQNNSLIRLNEKMMLWQYPAEVFKLFKKVYILTYLFDGSILKYYFELNRISYNKMTIDSHHQIVPYYYQSATAYRPLINIYRGADLNDFSSKPQTAFSATWFKNKSKSNEIVQLKNNIYNYIHNKVKAKSERVMWSTYENFYSKLKGKGYSNGFVPCNTRATNKYSDKNVLVYALNFFPKPSLTQFFDKNNVDFNQDLYSLSMMIQWIWRSSIRRQQRIDIYVPSQRMRNLLIDWLNQ